MLEAIIKDYFYNALVNFVLDGGDYDRHNIARKIKTGIVVCIHKIVEDSSNVDGILVGATRITGDNCPEHYKPLFHGLLALKNVDEITNEMANALADEIIASPSFHALNPTNMLLGNEDVVQAPVAMPESKSKVSADLIRETFYNEMVMQGQEAMEADWFTRDDLESQESNLYFALPSLTLIAAIESSRECKNGIRLLKHEIFTEENCPQVGNFPTLIATLLKLKPAILQLSPEQLRIVKQSLASDKPLSYEQEQLKTPELIQFISKIKNMAIDISRQQVFHDMVESVFETCLAVTKPGF